MLSRRVFSHPWGPLSAEMRKPTNHSPTPSLFMLVSQKAWNVKKVSLMQVFR